MGDNQPTAAPLGAQCQCQEGQCRFLKYNYAHILLKRASEYCNVSSTWLWSRERDL